MAGKPKLCWDSCAFISLLTGERRTEAEMKGLYQIEHMVNEGRAIVFTSTVTIVEVLECDLTQEQIAKFKGLFANPDVAFVSVDTRVAALAQEIRSYYKSVLPKTLTTPDSIHLATAIHFEATAFQTFDGCSVRKHPDDLLRLAQPIAGKYEMPITIPGTPHEAKSPETPPPMQSLLMGVRERSEEPEEN